MQAVFDGAVVAEADEADVVIIEGNRYFPPTAVTEGVLQTSPTPYTCPWKGECQYYSVRVDDVTHPDLAWAYPRPYESAIERVGVDFAGYVAFDPRVKVSL
ncbi:DUF427 domain-containing protein [Microbacterium capsulatum]|uniref:DUF427 domain-containing protein n=1 Tax=Microbacterium capsulatum TaxID=3041921 RepID=A0ABU0XKY6_9MICO|nr:DUF427 domain-containing protein [Microbacterium sp. ASV81]MDQ4215806.1 DUF427 domain-containing protein [Microbacterium sp. ASV81]